MHINQMFEFSKSMDREKFHKVFKNTCRNADCIDKMGEEYIDRSLEEKGITAIYRNSQYKKEIRILVNSGMISGSNRTEQDRFVRKLDKCIGKYFSHKYNVDDFSLSGVVMTADIK